MNPALRKYSFNEALLEELCTILKNSLSRNTDSDPIIDEEEPIRPVSIEFCRMFKKPKKAWNAFIKLNIFNLTCVSIKPGYIRFVCKAYNGKIITADVQKDPNRLFKHIVEHVLLGLADQVLNFKIEELAELQKQEAEKKAKVREELGLDIDLKVPEGLEMTDEMLGSIKNVINDIKSKQQTEEITDID